MQTYEIFRVLLFYLNKPQQENPGIAQVFLDLYFWM